MPRLTAEAPGEGGVSTVTGYIMTFFIATIILGVAIITNQAIVGAYGDVVARHALETIGNNLALRIENADLLVRASAGSGATVAVLNVTIPIPLQVAGRGYRFEVGSGSILLESTGSPVTQVRVPMNNSTPIASRSLSSSGGQMEIYYNTSSGQLDFR